MTQEDLARLHAACFIAPPPWSAEEIAATLAQPGAFLETRPHGFLIGRAVAGEAELLTLAVAPAARRQGTGRALVDAFDDAARARGATEAFLEVAADNLGARALYAATGWAEAGLRRGYYHPPGAPSVDALVLRKPLS
ncbi:GNAT family N-acetyltransferase [Acidimangrovimonas sediminis]|uniref:GNAT family N-acetyltransferase n=1 Tax=Acidimangrovimonas sediminis TaxID=2056283 RepID=UPI000C804B67|nr:GNAT family N-acetyltransferase [Acidimangrovimonas sediminis]